MIGLTARAPSKGLSGPSRLIPGRPSWLLGMVAAILMFMTVLALAAAMAADHAAGAWQSDVSATATLSVIAEEAEIEAQARAALAILSETPGIREVRVLEPAEQRNLLAPFLGTGIAFDAAVLPLMIEVETDRAVLDVGSLDARLAAEAPGAVFEDHSAWRLPLADAAGRQRDLAAAGAGLLLLALAGVAALGARIAAVSAAGPIRTLKDIGIPDHFLRRLLVVRLARALVAGAAAGAIAATLLAGGLASDSAEAGFDIGFFGWSWALPILALAVGAGLSIGAAALATDRVLRQWP